MTGIIIEPAQTKDVLRGTLYSLLIIFVMYAIPLIGVFAWTILPLPVLFYRLKTGRNGAGILMTVCLVVLTVLTKNIMFSMLYFGSLLMTGFLLGEFIEKHLSIGKTLSLTCFGLLGALLLFLFIHASAQGYGIEQFISGYVSRFQNLSNELITQSKQLYPDANLDLALYNKVSQLFMITLPGMLFSTYLMTALFNIILIRKLLKKHNIIVQSIENLTLWKSPDFMVFVLIILSALSFLPIQGLHITLINCLIVLLTVYFLQGMAIVSFLFEKKQAPMAFKLFFYILIALQPVFMLIIVGLGVFDTWINFRKLDTAT